MDLSIIDSIIIDSNIVDSIHLSPTSPKGFKYLAVGDQVLDYFSGKFHQAEPRAGLRVCTRCLRLNE